MSPALPTFRSSVFEDVDNGVALLAPRRKTRYGRIPDDFTLAERPHLTQSDPLPVRHSAPRDGVFGC
jgi:hypothetical protein